MSLSHAFAASSIVLALTVFAAPSAFADCGTSELCRVAGVQGVVKDNRLPVHISPSRDSSAKFNLREGDEVRNRSCESHQGEYWCKVEMPNPSLTSPTKPITESIGCEPRRTQVALQARNFGFS